MSSSSTTNTHTTHAHPHRLFCQRIKRNMADAQRLNPREELVIGSRRSELALIQTHHVRDRLQAEHESLCCLVHTMDTQGDRRLNVALSKIGDKGLFTHDLEVGLLSGSIHLAVHSLKDMPTSLPGRLRVWMRMLEPFSWSDSLFLFFFPPFFHPCFCLCFWSLPLG